MARKKRNRPETMPREHEQRASGGQPAAEWQLPSTGARIAGAALAVFTAILAVLLLRNAFEGDHATVDLVMRLVAGVLLVLLAIAVAALALVPALVRRAIAGE